MLLNYKKKVYIWKCFETNFKVQIQSIKKTKQYFREFIIDQVEHFRDLSNHS